MTPSQWFERTIKKNFPDLFLRGLFEFEIASISDGRINLKPVRAKWLKDIALVDLWPGASGHSAEPQVGSSVLMCFVDADESKPAIVSFAPLSSQLGKPASIVLDAGSIKLGSASGSVLRDGDTVKIVGAIVAGGAGTAEGIITLTLGTAETPPNPSRVKA